MLSSETFGVSDSNGKLLSAGSPGVFEFSANKIEHFKSYKELMVETNKVRCKRTRLYLDYTKEKEGEKEYKKSEREKFLFKEETELIPFQLFYARFTGGSVEL